MTSNRLNAARTAATATQMDPTLIGRGQSGRSLRRSRNAVNDSTWENTYPMFDKYRIARLLAMNRMSNVLTTMSTVIALAGTWNLFRWWNHLIVMSSRAIPYSARP